MKESRNISLDILKGVLIIEMMLHHSIHSVSTAANQYLMSYISLVTGSFIFVSGFIISNIYLKKYNINDKKLPLRLLLRGAKLILMFTVLNIALTLFFETIYHDGSRSINYYLNNVHYIYLWGDTEMTSFEVLLPIAYLLSISALLVVTLKGRARIVAAVLSMILIFIDMTMKFKFTSSYNFELILIGLFGIGFLTTERIEGIINKYNYRSMTVSVIYLISMSPLFIFLIDMFGKVIVDHLSYPLYVVGIMSNFYLFYFIGKKIPRENIVIDKIIFLGRNSLFSYVIHIGLIKIISIAIAGFPSFNKIIELFILTLIFTILSVMFVEHYRKRSLVFDRTYKIIFT
ncbi:MAG: hypothetical protein HY808_01330 [Nitrospirae bacterium]|nr:hypothetical protein [Nitrospirota bacterium]